MYIVKLNNVPSESCETSQANDPHKITFEIIELLFLYIYKTFNILGPSCAHIFCFFLFYLDLHVPNFFLTPCLSLQKGKRCIYFEVPLVHKVTKFI